MGQKIEFKDGKLMASGDMVIDGNKDGQPSVVLSASISIDAAEAVEEIFKTDAKWLMDLLAKLGVK